VGRGVLCALISPSFLAPLRSPQKRRGQDRPSFKKKRRRTGAARACCQYLFESHVHGLYPFTSQGNRGEKKKEAVGGKAVVPLFSFMTSTCGKKGRKKERTRKGGNFWKGRSLVRSPPPNLIFSTRCSDKSGEKGGVRKKKRERGRSRLGKQPRRRFSRLKSVLETMEKKKEESASSLSVGGVGRCNRALKSYFLISLSISFPSPTRPIQEGDERGEKKKKKKKGENSYVRDRKGRAGATSHCEPLFFVVIPK